MELLRLRRRLELARRGHKLLKDKLDGLVQRFFSIKNAYLALHEKLEPDLVHIFSKSVMSSALSHPQSFEEEFLKRGEAAVETSTKNIMGIKIPAYQLSLGAKPSYAPLLATVEFGEALSGFTQALPALVDLAAASKALRLIATQIIETRRRVNALEYILIPELGRNVRLIRMQLSERERSTQVVLLKKKEE